MASFSARQVAHLDGSLRQPVDLPDIPLINRLIYASGSPVELANYQPIKLCIGTEHIIFISCMLCDGVVVIK